MKHCSRMLIIDPEGAGLQHELRAQFAKDKIHVGLADTSQKIERLFSQKKPAPLDEPVEQEVEQNARVGIADTAKKIAHLFRLTWLGSKPLATRFDCAVINATGDFNEQTGVNAPSPITLAIQLANRRVPTLLYSPVHEREESLKVHRYNEEPNVCAFDPSIIPEAAKFCINRRREALRFIATLNGIRSEHERTSKKGRNTLKKMLKKADPLLQKTLCTLLRFEGEEIRQLLHDLQIL